LYQALLNDARFHDQLLDFDRDIAQTAREAGCPRCDGRLHSARFLRKPRGVPIGVDPEYPVRFSFCCAVDGCRGRMTPASLRFLGGKVWLSTSVVLATAMQQGITPARVQQLSAAFGIDRRTLVRWRRWWLATFAGPFQPIVMAAFMPPPELTGVPGTLLDRFLGDAAAKVIHLLRLLAPLTGGASARHAS
jgi:hypothetical protein